MGKIRVKTIGDEELEKKQAEEAKKRQEQKKAEKSTASEVEEVEKKKKTGVKKINTNTSSRSEKYLEKTKLIDPAKMYSLAEALKILPDLSLSSFDETVELHINTTDTGISGSVILPHGTGKKTRVAIAEGTNAAALDELIKKVEKGIIDFDILIATPDVMPKLARLAKTLGPRGLMPNPKNGTISTKPQEIAKKYEGGQINYKTESKFPLIHLSVGKISFGEKKLSENIKSIFVTLSEKQLKNVTLKSTMSPGIKIDLATL